MQENPFETKVIKNKKLEDGVLLKVSVNNTSRRIFVDFSSKDGKLRIQKSFQDTLEGRRQSEEFQESFSSLADIKKYFGVA